MADINRRGLVVGAGLAFGLSIWPGQTRSSERANEARAGGARLFGPGDAYQEDIGDWPSQTPHDPSGSMVAFEPKNTHLVYIKLTAAGLFSAFANFSKNPNDADISAFIDHQFERISPASDPWDNAVSSGRDFKNWGFGDQGTIFIFVDNGEMISLDPVNRIQFAKYSAKTGATGDPADVLARNNCFLNPRVVRLGDRDLIAIDNWYVDETGKKIPTAADLHGGPMPAGAGRRYAMNIHVLIQGTAAGTMIPIVIDPDTGNGLGHKP